MGGETGGGDFRNPASALEEEAGPGAGPREVARRGRKGGGSCGRSPAGPDAPPARLRLCRRVGARRGSKAAAPGLLAWAEGVRGLHCPRPPSPPTQVRLPGRRRRQPGSDPQDSAAEAEKCQECPEPPRPTLTNALDEKGGWATMKVLVAKGICLLGIFGLMLAGTLMPVKIMEADYEKVHRSKRAIALCNSFGGGVFLATCFNALLPAVREKLQELLKKNNMATDYPLAETIMLMGFFMTVFVEQLVLTFRKEKPSFIDLETFNAGSDVGSDSEYESPFIEPSWGRGHHSHSEHGHHSHGEHGHHSHGLNTHEASHTSPLRLLSLVIALSAHSVFEGLALGLQEEASRVMSLFVGVAIHETLVAVALGVNMVKTGLTFKEAAKLSVTVSLMIPLGIGIGVAIESVQNTASHVLSVLLQGMAGGTFLFITFFEIMVKELEDKSDRLLKVLFLVVGYAILAGLVYFKW